MNRQYKNRLLLVAMLLVGAFLGLVAGLAGPALAVPAPTATPAPTADPDPRPAPPYIQEWGIPDPQGGEPAGCAGQTGCGVMCFYVGENATENQFELSCVPWIFEQTMAIAYRAGTTAGNASGTNLDF